MTTKGRKVYEDKETGENYSERSITFETDDGWITIPSVDAEGNQMSQAELEKFVEENGPVDPLTGEELPLFESVEDAENYAKERSDNLMPETEEVPEGYHTMPDGTMMKDSDHVEMYHGGMACGCDDCSDGMMSPDSMDYHIGHDEVSGNPIPPGSNAMNVRDDIPAVLSDGEYVVPADVVRYHGLKTFMALRDEAKLGLMAMHFEGQIQTIGDENEYEEAPTEQEESDSEELADTEVQAEDGDAEEGQGEFQEEYETPEGNTVEVASGTIEEELMMPEYEEYDEEEYPSDPGQFSYRPSMSFVVMKR